METEPIESVFFVSTNLCWIDFITILFLWKKSDSPKVFWFRRKMGKERHKALKTKNIYVIKLGPLSLASL